MYLVYLTLNGIVRMSMSVELSNITNGNDRINFMFKEMWERQIETADGNDKGKSRW